jgi:OOP family OmpA-OmpF porin
MFKKTLIAAAIASMAGGAYAETTGYYMGGGIGIWDVDESGIIEDSAMSARISGGFKFNEFLGVEGAYVYLGEVEESASIDVGGQIFSAKAKLDGSAWELSLRPSYPFTDSFEGYARLGWGFYDMEVEVSAPGLSITESDSDDGFVWAVGGAWAMNDRFNLFGEYSVPDTEADVYIMTFGATYNF